MKKSNVARKALLLVTLSSLVLSACGSSGSADKGAGTAVNTAYSGDYGFTEYAAEEAVYDDFAEADAMAPQAPDAGEVADTSRKLITTVNLSAETEDFDEMVPFVETKVKELGGYIESSSVYNGNRYGSASRYASITARIPANRLDEFVGSVEGNSNITNKSLSVEDVTLKYVDIDSRKKALKTEEERLLEILDNAETVEDLITVEQRLSDVRYEIESIESQLRTYDNLVDYSTVYLDIEEVKVYTPVEKEGVGSRISKGFKESLESVGEGFTNFFVYIVVHLPQIIVFAVIVLIIVLIIRAIAKKSKKKRIEKYAKMQAQAQQANVQTSQGGQPIKTPGIQTPAATNTGDVNTAQNTASSVNKEVTTNSNSETDSEKKDN